MRSGKKLSEDIKEELRVPLGNIYTDIKKLLDDHPNKKIIAVGDQTVLSFLREELNPYISVFDFKTLRKRIPKRDVEFLKKTFPKAKSLRNLPSTISKRLVNLAPAFIKSGGALRIYGEEDLAALIFMYFAKDEIIVYGQPKKGMVVVDPNLRRKRIEELFDKVSDCLF